MPDLKISQLTVASSIGSTDVLPLVQGGVTKGATAETIGLNGCRPQNNFWSNDTPAAWVEKIPDRLLIGAATDGNAGSASNDGPASGPYFTGLPSTIQSGASYVIRDAQVGVVSRNGLIAIGGISRASDYAGSRPAGFRDPIAIAGYTINDVTGTTVGAWAGYFEAQRESGAGNVKGLEVAVKNKGADVIPTPYNTGTGSSHGIWMAGGSDASYGGSPANPCSSALVVLANASTWNTGITFTSDGLTDRGSGVYNAIDLAKGHSLTWFQQGVEAFALRSIGDTPGQRQRMIVDVRSVSFTGNDDKAFFVMNSLNNSNTNHLEVTSSGGSAPSLSAAGVGSDVDILFIPKGTGVVRVGSGDALNIYTAASPQLGRMVSGTSASPNATLGSLFKVERTSNIAAASVTGDGSEQMASIVGIGAGTSGNEAQPIGVYGGAKSSYTGSGGGKGDACGVYGSARFTGSGVGTAIGGFFGARRDTSTGRANGAEVHCGNFSGVAGAYNSTGFSNTTGLWLGVSGDADSGVGIAFGNGFGFQYKVGIGFNAQVTGGKTGGVADSSIRDDSTSAISLDIRGTHATAAINIANGSGGILQNSTQDNFFEGINKHGATAIAANNAQTVTVGNVGPGGAGIAIVEWLKVKNAAGTTRYVPMFG